MDELLERRSARASLHAACDESPIASGNGVGNRSDREKRKRNDRDSTNGAAQSCARRSSTNAATDGAKQGTFGICSTEPYTTNCATNATKCRATRSQ
jgi:hypothetical protein